jgi:hypothetical protein
MPKEKKSELLERLTLEVGLHSILKDKKGVLLMHDKHLYSPFYVNGILNEMANPNVLKPLAEEIAKKQGIPVDQFKFTAVVLRSK